MLLALLSVDIAAKSRNDKVIYYLLTFFVTLAFPLRRKRPRHASWRRCSCLRGCFTFNTELRLHCRRNESKSLFFLLFTLADRFFVCFFFGNCISIELIDVSQSMKRAKQLMSAIGLTLIMHANCIACMKWRVNPASGWHLAEVSASQWGPSCYPLFDNNAAPPRLIKCRHLIDPEAEAAAASKGKCCQWYSRSLIQSFPWMYKRRHNIWQLV